MTWVRYDDNVANHPKVAPLDDATYRLWREAIEWSSHNLTDGVIRTWQLTVTSTRASKPRAARLVKADLWHLPGTPCDSPKCPPSGEDGWVIHDYWDYQRTAEQVRAEQEANRERQRRWMEKARAGKRGSPNGVPNAQPNGATNAVTNGTDDGSNNGNPAPPRPAPKGRVGTDVPTAPPAAVGDGTAPGVGAKPKPTRRCPTCGNATNSAYHANICAKSAA